MHINKFVGTKSEKTITEGMIQAAVAWPHLLKTLSFGYLSVCEFAILLSTGFLSKNRQEAR